MSVPCAVPRGVCGAGLAGAVDVGVASANGNGRGSNCKVVRRWPCTMTSSFGPTAATTASAAARGAGASPGVSPMRSPALTQRSSNQAIQRPSGPAKMAIKPRARAAGVLVSWARPVNAEGVTGAAAEPGLADGEAWPLRVPGVALTVALSVALSGRIGSLPCALAAMLAASKVSASAPASNAVGARLHSHIHIQVFNQISGGIGRPREGRLRP